MFSLRTSHFGFDEDFVRGTIIELLEALDFLHTHGEVVHTGTATSCHASSFAQVRKLEQHVFLADQSFQRNPTIFVYVYRDHQYVTLKLYVHTSLVHRELPFYHHVACRMA
jgi:hypothetical protein